MSIYKIKCKACTKQLICTYCLPEGALIRDNYPHKLEVEYCEHSYRPLYDKMTVTSISKTGDGWKKYRMACKECHEHIGKLMVRSKGDDESNDSKDSRTAYVTFTDPGSAVLLKRVTCHGRLSRRGKKGRGSRTGKKRGTKTVSFNV